VKQGAKSRKKRIGLKGTGRGRFGSSLGRFQENRTGWQGYIWVIRPLFVHLTLPFLSLIFSLLQTLSEEQTTFRWGFIRTQFPARVSAVVSRPVRRRHRGTLNFFPFLSCFFFLCFCLFYSFSNTKKLNELKKKRPRSKELRKTTFSTFGFSSDLGVSGWFAWSRRFEWPWFDWGFWLSRVRLCFPFWCSPFQIGGCWRQFVCSLMRVQVLIRLWTFGPLLLDRFLAPCAFFLCVPLFFFQWLLRRFGFIGLWWLGFVLKDAEILYWIGMTKGQNAFRIWDHLGLEPDLFSIFDFIGFFGL